MATEKVTALFETKADELVAKVANIQAALKDKQAELQRAQVDQAKIEDQMADLTAMLKRITGSADWRKLQSAIGKAAQEAEDAVQRLVDAMAEAGIETE